MNRQDLIAMINQILDPDENTSSEDIDRLLEEFISSIKHPGGSDLIYYPENWGLNSCASAEDIANEAMSWAPRVVSMKVSYARPHPNRDDLICYGVEIEGHIQTQVVSSLTLKPRENCAVALSGVRLPDGSTVQHVFVDQAFSAGVILGRTGQPVGMELAPPQ
ncbi:bacteriocin immunity protein [Bremerella sp. P1]|uniref:bacteriocin immunity protein n=1 Tax=Bremerella sp. P1 TaxID=3026424 RepID=UPI002368F06D|nr:bacteriocin immunity protein [Bremerella sp. P1]WDI42600.1 bacteriocin immunity protein [Bremerella sp. P1]